MVMNMDKPRFFYREMTDGKVVIYDRQSGYDAVAGCLYPVPGKPQGARSMAQLAVEAWNAVTKRSTQGDK